MPSMCSVTWQGVDSLPRQVAAQRRGEQRIHVFVEFENGLSLGIRRRVTIFEQGTVLELQSEKGMVGGSDSLKKKVTGIKNFLDTVSRDKTECVVTHIEDLNTKTVEIKRVFEELKASMKRKIINVLGDMDGLAEAIGGKLKEMKT
ncbi:hypothetical protein ACE6H2_015364 [Prunus campanulata]